MYTYTYIYIYIYYIILYYIILYFIILYIILYYIILYSYILCRLYLEYISSLKRISTRCLFAFFGTHCWLRRAFAQNVHWAQIVHIMLGLRFMIYHGESDEEMDDFGVTPIGWQTMCTFHSDDEVSLMQPEKQQVGICLDWWDSPRKVIE